MYRLSDKFHRKSDTQKKTRKKGSPFLASWLKRKSGGNEIAKEGKYLLESNANEALQDTRECSDEIRKGLISEFNDKRQYLQLGIGGRAV